MEHHIKDIRSLLDDPGLKEVALMGHSLGAFISLAFCAKHPERVNRIVLVDGGARSPKSSWTSSFRGSNPLWIALERCSLRRIPTLEP
ncbi:MAG: hypothetical protein CVU57_30865 [Deltaproteobacteria bacterium HGW-Deltaproteobacteria-15]|nr:MAG: hypothetical protein CVU57_30865 [Deltaproteobacteria bacterium HGW-Deltaproteobacteria-15]